MDHNKCATAVHGNVCVPVSLLEHHLAYEEVIYIPEAYQRLFFHRNAETYS